MILTIDFGTTNLKAALIDKKGHFFNFLSKKVPTQVNNKIYEVDSKLYLDFILEYLTTYNSKDIEAIAISSNGPSFLSVYSEISFSNGTFDFNGSNTRLWMDKRGEKYSKPVSDFYGSYIDGSFFLPAILNIKDNEKLNYKNTKYFLTIDAFINYALTKKALIVNNADLLMKYYWNQDSLNYFNLEQHKFPKFIDSGKIIGKIDKSIANYFNLSEDIKIIAGGSDFYFSIIGSNISKKNVLADINGTSEGLNLCIEKPIKDNRFLCYEHPLKNHYNLSGVISNSGISINWIRKILNINSDEFNKIYELAKEAKPNNLIFLPYLTGERAPIWNPEATGQFFNLTINTRAEELSKAVIEGNIFAFKSVLNCFEELGFTIDEVHTTTSRYNLDFYYQLKSNIINKKLVIYKTQSAELLGLSILGYTSIKVYNDYGQATNNIEFESKEFYPQKKDQDYFDKKFNLFNELYAKTKSLMSK